MSHLIMSGFTALALLGVCAFVPGVRDVIREPIQCVALTARRGGNFEPVKVDGPGASALIMGDSYTEGALLERPAQGWAYRLVGAQGWNAFVDGIGSTGFVTESGCGNDAFTARAEKMDGAEVVVIQGGLNDFRDDPSKISAAAKVLVAGAPGSARVVVVGPPAAPARPEALDIDISLSRGLEGTRAEYISTVGWELDYLPDGTHLTEDGHEIFAANVAAALK